MQSFERLNNNNLLFLGGSNELSSIFAAPPEYRQVTRVGPLMFDFNFMLSYIILKKITLVLCDGKLEFIVLKHDGTFYFFSPGASQSGASNSVTDFSVL